METIKQTLEGAVNTQTSFNGNVKALNDKIKEGKNKKDGITNGATCVGAVNPGPKKKVCDDIKAIKLDIKLDTTGRSIIKSLFQFSHPQFAKVFSCTITISLS